MNETKNRHELERIHADEAIFWCRDAADLPAPERLREAVTARLSGVVVFSEILSEVEKSRCVEAVQAALPAGEVCDTPSRFGFDRIRFARVLERAEILRHAAELVESAREFRVTATNLCGQLAAKIGISPTQLSRYGQHQPPEIVFEQVGILNAEWKYFFHGIECGFGHRETGQHLDVIFGFRDEFGVVSPWFWIHFLETTAHYAALTRWLALGASDLKRASEVLHDAGLLIEIPGAFGDDANCT